MITGLPVAWKKLIFSRLLVMSCLVQGLRVYGVWGLGLLSLIGLQLSLIVVAYVSSGTKPKP